MLRNLTAGSSNEQVTDHLGHEDIQTTRKWYARIINAKRRSAVEKMDNLSRYVTTLKLMNKNKKPRDLRGLLFKHLLFISATPFSS